MNVIIVGVVMAAIGFATSPFAQNHDAEWKIMASGLLTGFGIVTLVCGVASL